MTISTLYSSDDYVTDFGIDVPVWIDQDITPATIAAIMEGGCASGAYMPAVTYYKANDIMSQYGDDVLQYIEDMLGELPQFRQEVSWTGIAVFFLSCAVELWADSVSDELAELIEEEQEEEE